MLILAITLVVITAFFIGLFALQIVQNKRISRKLRILNNENRTQLITMSLPTKNNEKLVIEINRLIRAKEEQSQIYRIKEQKLQQAISNASHDMRTPLTAVMGYIHLLNSNDLTAEEQANYMSIVETRARSLSRIVQDFYDLSRLDIGEYQFDNTLIDVSQMCLDLMAVYYDDFENLGFTIESNLLSKAPQVYADKNAVARVYENIFGNAIRHGTDVLIADSWVESGKLIIQIKNGSNVLSAREIERVFERSYTTNDSRANESTGLGLSICKALLNEMGHDILAAYHEGLFSLTITWSIESE